MTDTLHLARALEAVASALHLFPDVARPTVHYDHGHLELRLAVVTDVIQAMRDPDNSSDETRARQVDALAAALGMPHPAPHDVHGETCYYSTTSRPAFAPSLQMSVWTTVSTTLRAVVQP